MALGAIESLLGRKWEAFNRTKEENSQVLAFDEQSLHIVLDTEGELEQITIFAPNEAVLFGVQLIGENLHQLSGSLAALGMNFQPVDVGLWDEKAKILVIEIDGSVDGVEVHRSG